MSDERPEALIELTPHKETGELCSRSGQYAVYDDRGNDLRREVTMVKGRAFPPVAGGGFYRLRDASQHQGGWQDAEADDAI